MSSTSNTSTYYAQTSGKSQHYYTSHPPSSHPVDRDSLRTYRLSNYNQDSHRPPMASAQSAASISSTHQTRVKQQTDAILSQFYQR
ncbi:hypothetical protein GGS24DRAFT_415245 [Hypoxylon argillaceum]|nr:hypothetical protein GGS24DRAFT_415245 [Hypoxylon argillaceum]KAI1154097.1 hypothetical protein F4825DRAFT_208597 [Nemania diffusa]